MNKNDKKSKKKKPKPKPKIPFDGVVTERLVQNEAPKKSTKKKKDP